MDKIPDFVKLRKAKKSNIITGENRYRVQKLLSEYGYCSRRKAEEMIEKGRVKVNGNIITIGDSASHSDKIYVDDVLVEKQPKRYLVFNKPIGYVTALHDKHEKTIMDYINIDTRVFPVGRLDKDTSGLLILTNDGDMANEIMHPRYEIKKTYFVELDKTLEPIHKKSLEKGVFLDDGKTSPAKIDMKTPKKLEITIHEGKNRIVRRMFESKGYKIKKLERVRIGDLTLAGIMPGKYKELSLDELKKKIF